MKDSIYEIRRLCSNNAIYWTEHVAKRLIKRNIAPQDVKAALMGGTIIEDMELLKSSLTQAMTLAKHIAKHKFTPKKYRKDDTK